MDMAKTQSGEIETVLVDGGAGYLGSVLVRKLLALGDGVRVFDNLLHGDGAIKDLSGQSRFEVCRGELRNIDAVFRVVKGVDAVIHLAAIVGDQACNLEPAITVQVNAVASRVIFEACRFHGVKRFIFASTCSVYGWGDEVLSEDSELNPVSLYARSKIEAERSILQLADEQLAPCILRAGTLFGLSPRMRFDLVINALTARAVADRQFTVFGGEQWRPFVHVEDAADAYVRCLQAPRDAVWGKIYNMGDNRLNHRILEVGQIVSDLVAGSRMLVDEKSSDRRDYRVSFDRIESALGFRAQRTVVDGVREIRDAMTAGNLNDYRDRKYSNYQSGFEDYYASLLKYDSIDKM